MPLLFSKRPKKVHGHFLVSWQDVMAWDSAGLFRSKKFKGTDIFLPN
jgi:hypothetical protein